jgi:hypothetical protein
MKYLIATIMTLFAATTFASEPAKKEEAKTVKTVKADAKKVEAKVEPKAAEKK